MAIYELPFKIEKNGRGNSGDLFENVTRNQRLLATSNYIKRHLGWMFLLTQNTVEIHVICLTSCMTTVTVLQCWMVNSNKRFLSKMAITIFPLLLDF